MVVRRYSGEKEDNYWENDMEDVGEKDRCGGRDERTRRKRGC